MDDDSLEGISMMLWRPHRTRKPACPLELIVAIARLLDMLQGRSMPGKGLGSDAMVTGLLRDALAERSRARWSQ